jgi:hypothetical protein
MSYGVLFRKRVIDKEWYSLGAYATHTLATVVAKGEYYYRGGVTPEYKVVDSDQPSQTIPSYLYPTLISCVGFLTSEEQEVFKNEHLKYLRSMGEL